MFVLHAYCLQGGAGGMEIETRQVYQVLKIPILSQFLSYRDNLNDTQRLTKKWHQGK